MLAVAVNQRGLCPLEIGFIHDEDQCGYQLELVPANRSQRSQPVFYDNLPLLRPENKDKLIADLSERTGLNVVRVDVVRLDMLRDAADLTVYYTEPRD